jgi:hypothetical protein
MTAVLLLPWRTRSRSSEDEVTEMLQAARRTKAFGRGAQGYAKGDAEPGHSRWEGCRLSTYTPHYKTSVQRHLVHAFRNRVTDGELCNRRRNGAPPPPSAATAVLAAEP